MTAAAAAEQAPDPHGRQLETKRWYDGYVNHSASALRRRVVAAGNGHAGEAPHPARERVS